MAVHAAPRWRPLVIVLLPGLLFTGALLAVAIGKETHPGGYHGLWHYKTYAWLAVVSYYPMLVGDMVLLAATAYVADRLCPRPYRWLMWSVLAVDAVMWSAAAVVAAVL